MKYIDAEKLKRLVGELKDQAKRNCCDSWGIVPDALEEVEDFITSLQQEQTELDLEKEIDTYLEPIKVWQIQEAPYTSMENIARHFYQLGLNARKGGTK